MYLALGALPPFRSMGVLHRVSQSAARSAAQSAARSASHIRVLSRGKREPTTPRTKDHIVSDLIKEKEEEEEKGSDHVKKPASSSSAVGRLTTEVPEFKKTSNVALADKNLETLRVITKKLSKKLGLCEHEESKILSIIETADSADLFDD
mgnify:CR=1 FL=1